MIRFFDIFFSLIGLILLSPILLLLIVIILLDSKGPAFFKQTRVGKGGSDFQIYKFRSMYIDSDKRGSITVGDKDPRITPSGYYIRKLKLDELPQLINVLIGDMSIVGPRPELRRFVDLYTDDQRKVLQVCPGITDFASIKFRNENELLQNKANPEDYYIDFIMPEKLRLNLIFVKNRTVLLYFKVIFITILTLVFPGREYNL